MGIDTDGTNTRSLVAGRFELSEGYANSAFSTALGYIGGAGEISASINWTPPSISLSPPAGISGLSVVSPSSPDITPISVTPVDFTHSVPTIEDHEITTYPIPEFTVSLPNFFIPQPPDTEVPTFNETAPDGLAIEIPIENIPDLPPLPTITEVLPPDEPEFALPEFTATMPVADLTPPDNLYAWNEAAYNTEFNTTLREKIKDGILNGGQGMLPEVESAIYERAKTRLDSEMQINEQLALNDMASRGSRLPTGALIARMNEIRKQNLLAQTDLNRDIIIKSADLAYQYSTFIIEKGLTLEHEYMALFNSIQQRAFEATRIAVEFAFREYEATVQAFTARIEAYKTEAEIFKARIQAEIARAELYKTTIEGRKLSLEMQGLMVDLYGKQLNAIDTMAKIYATKMEAAKVQSEINSVEVERFKALVDAYKAEVEGVTAEYNLYQAQIAGEAEKAKMYAYQVDGYKSVVEAYKSRSEVDISTLRAKIEKAQGEINIYTAQIDKYRADIQSNVSDAEIQAKAEGLKLQVFDGEIRKFTSIVSALVESYRAEANVEIADADVQVRYGEILARLEEAEAQVQAELIKAKAQVSSQLASAALSSVSAGASLGYSASDTESSSYSSSNVSSTSTNTNYNHHYSN